MRVVSFPHLDLDQWEAAYPRDRVPHLDLEQDLGLNLAWVEGHPVGVVPLHQTEVEVETQGVAFLQVEIHEVA